MNHSFKKLPNADKQVLVRTPYSKKLIIFTENDLEHILKNEYGVWYLGERLISYKYITT